MTSRDLEARISFGPTVGYLAMSQKAAEQEAKDGRLPLYIRVRAAAVARADRVGHARFYPGELQDWLGVPRPAAVSKAIAKAKALGLVKQESSARCLVLAHYVWQSGKWRGPAECLIHDRTVARRGKRGSPPGETQNHKTAGQGPDG